MAMDCREYTVNFLSADADDELYGAERELADEHLRGCAECRTRLAGERALKQLIRRHSARVRAPADVRLRIRAALGGIDGREARRGIVARASGSASRGRARTLRRYVAGSAIAALIAIAVLAGGGKWRHVQNQPRPVPEFDFAISKFAEMANDFQPNVPIDAFNSSDGIYYAWVVTNSNRQPDERLDLARSYSALDMPSDLYNFIDSGYRVFGGRFDRLPDGNPVSYTLYRGPNGALMDICIKSPRLKTPIGAVYWVGLHSFYRYKHYSLCVTLDTTGRFVSILVTSQPIINLVRDVTLADIQVTAER